MSTLDGPPYCVAIVEDASSPKSQRLPHQLETNIQQMHLGYVSSLAKLEWWKTLHSGKTEIYPHLQVCRLHTKKEDQNRRQRQVNWELLSNRK
jgi:hypothetical protein